jgi:hypothetical protein
VRDVAEVAPAGVVGARDSQARRWTAEEGRVDGQRRYSVECKDGQMSGVASSYSLQAMRLFSLLIPKCFKVDTSGTGELRHLRVLTSSTSTRPQHHADRHHGQLSCNQCLAWSPDNGTP